MRTIIAAVDYSEITPEVIKKAAGLASALDARLEILHIVSPEPAFVGYTAYAYPGRDERADELKKEKALLKETVEGVRELGITASAYMKEAPVAEGILEFADEHEADLIVLGTHGKGVVKRALMGSASQDVVHKSKIPVLLIPAAKALVAHPVATMTEERSESLYDRIGGEQAIADMVVEFYAKVLADPELRPFFKETQIERLHAMQREFFSAALGGPIKYTGRSLHSVHAGRGIEPHHMKRFVDHLLETLDQFALSETELRDVIARIDTYADEIMGGGFGIDG